MTHLPLPSTLTLGRFNTLTVTDFNRHGILLEGVDGEEVLLPKRDIPKRKPIEIGDELTLFLYHDSKNRLVATTKKPYAEVGEFADLQVVEINEVGIFLDWGLPKDVLLPYSEEVGTLHLDDFVIVYLYLDEVSGRITATAKIEQYLDQSPAPYQVGEAVKLLIADRTDMGFKAIINDAHWGLIHNNELFKEIYTGDIEEGFVTNIRPDGKIDLALQPKGKKAKESLEELIMRRLSEHGGHLPFSDKSNPADIHKVFGVSKSNFKRAIGGLFRERKIIIRPNEIIYNPNYVKGR